MQEIHHKIGRAIGIGFVAAACLGTIGIVAVIHLQWVKFIPDPWFTPDSTTYLGPALNLLSGQPFNIAPTRTPGYPLFLWAGLKVFNSLPAICVLQHILLLATGLLSAFLGYRWIKKSWVMAILIFATISLMPWSLVGSHQLLTETLYTFLQILAVVLFAIAWNAATTRWWIATGLATMAAVFVRPSGIVLCAAFSSLILLYLGKETQAKTAALVWGFTVIVLACVWCTTNLSTKGFWGFTSFTGQTLFGRTAYLLEVDRIHNQQLAMVLRPFYYPKDERLLDPNWVQNNEKGLITALRRHGLLQPHEDAALRKLAWRAIGDHPFRLIRDHVRRSIFYFRSMYSMPPVVMSPVPPTLNSIAQYLAFAKTYPRVETLTVFAKSSPQNYFAHMNARTLYPLQPGDWISALCWPLRWLETAIPLFLIIAFILFSAWHRDPLFDLMWLIGVFHILMTTMVTWDSQPTLRHSIPMEPLSILIIVRALCPKIKCAIKE